MPGIYLTTDPMRAATQYATPRGTAVRVEVSTEFANSIRQLGGTNGGNMEYFVNTADGAAVLNSTIRWLGFRDAINTGMSTGR